MKDRKKGLIDTTLELKCEFGSFICFPLFANETYKLNMTKVYLIPVLCNMKAKREVSYACPLPIVT